MKTILQNLLIVFMLMPLLMQAQRDCGTMEYLEQQIQQDPTMLQRMEQIERLTEQYLQSGTKLRNSVIKIPVVVHVVYNGSAENVSDAQVQSQIDVLNADFRKLNSDAYKFRTNTFGSINADVQIEFCLATVAPDGSATDGIVRMPTTKTSFSSNNEIKYTSTGGSDAWPSDKYLNFWVGDLGTSLLGYAQFPGGNAATDGIVCHYRAFGSINDKPAGETWEMFQEYNLGRTATHEVGHWLNLRHIWGDGSCRQDDYVSDTPLAGNSNGGCPSPSTNSCKERTNDLPDMWENYMDYTYDRCMYAFTNGQTDRMRALFASGGVRASLLNSPGCGGSSTPTCSTPSGLGATVTDVSATLNWTAVSGASSYTVAYGLAGNLNLSATASTNSVQVSGLTACTNYEFKVSANCDGAASSFSATHAFTTTGCGGGGDPVCTAPTNLQASQLNPKKSRLSWDAVTGGVGYEVNYAGSITYTSNAQLNVNSGGGAWSVRTDCGSGLYSAWSDAASPARFSYSFSESFKIYPNPASDEIIVEFGEMGTAVINVVLTNVLGRTVKQQRNLDAGTGYTFFDITDLQEGIYFIQINDGEQLLKISRVVVNK